MTLTLENKECNNRHTGGTLARINQTSSIKYLTKSVEETHEICKLNTWKPFDFTIVWSEKICHKAYSGYTRAWNQQAVHPGGKSLI